MNVIINMIVLRKISLPHKYYKESLVDESTPNNAQANIYINENHTSIDQDSCTTADLPRNTNTSLIDGYLMCII